MDYNQWFHHYDKQCKKRKQKINILIIGATGLIGSNLFKYLNKKKINTIGTYFKNKKRKLIKYNLEKDNINKLLNSNLISHIIIASGGNKKLDNVETNYKYENNIGYIKLGRFSKKTFDEFYNTYIELENFL